MKAYCSHIRKHDLVLASLASILSTASVVFAVTSASAQSVTLPPPEQGSFSTAFDFIPDGRLVVFTGTEVKIQSQRGSSTFNLIGSLPDKFRGGSDPAFVVTGTLGSFFLLGTGAGGSKFPNQPFNGSIFALPRTGGQANLVTNIPFHTGANFRGPLEVFVSRGDASFSQSAIERINVTTQAVQTVIDKVPGASAGVGVDRLGNVYTGIGSDPNGKRTGEIRRFSRRIINQAIQTGIPFNFNDGEFVAQVLSAGGLLFDEEGHLWVSGGDLLGNGQQGFIAEVDPKTGKILRRIDPTDGNPDGGPQVFFSIAISRPFSCTIGAVNSFDPNRTFYEIDACESLPHHR
jgi:streptogramin lyase